MPRRIGEAVNELKIHDNISNSDIVLYYRTPTTKEQAAYANESVQRKRNKVVFRQFEARLKYGLKILQGFREGDFERQKDGKVVPLSSDPKSPHHDPDWKGLLKEHAADIIALLAAHVFDVSTEVEEPDDDEDAPDDDEDGGESDPSDVEDSKAAVSVSDAEKNLP